MTFKEVVFPPPAGKEQKISLHLSQFVPPPAPKSVATPSRPEPVPVKPPVPQPVKKEPVKEVIPPTPPVKKKILDEKKRLVVEKRESEENNVTKAVSKKEEKIVKKKVKKKPKKVLKKKVVKKKTKKRVIKRTKVKKVQKRTKQRRSKDALANALMGAGTSMYPASRPASSGSYVTKMIKQLYGKEFNTFSPSQKKFIKNNLGRIHQITQRTLTINGYPDVAVRTKQQGTNVVTFYLHPNGDITGLRLKRRIGYAALDQNTLEVIRIAYKDYPRPKSKTKITFYVQYSIY